MTNEVKVDFIKIQLSNQKLIRKLDVILKYFETDKGKVLQIKDELDLFIFRDIKECDIEKSQIYLNVLDGVIQIELQEVEETKKLKKWLENQTKSNESIYNKNVELIEDSFNCDIRRQQEIGVDSTEFLKKQISKMITEYRVDPTYYSPFAVVCQSSGFGKSRACLSLINDFYVVYCCLRDANSTGYPKRSSLASHLLKSQNQEKDFNCYFNLFIDILNKEIKTKDSEDFFKVYGKEDINGKDELVKRLHEKIPDGNIEISKHSDEKKPMLFIFDEASYLLPKNYFTIRSVLSKLNNIFVLFLDTFTELSTFMPSAQSDPSDRVKKGEKLFDPIYLLPNWDVFVDESKIKNIFDTVVFENVCMYGRPLWGSWIHTKNNSNGKYKEVDNKQLYHLAISKLTCGKEEFSKFDSNDFLAILSSRVGVVKPKLISSRQTLVAKHMAVFTFFDIKKGIYEIDYPSEPFLAAAGAYWMNSENKLISILDNLIVNYESSLISQGDKGELIAKIILLKAIDYAFETYSSNTNISPYLNTVRVGYFLQSLYGRCSEKCGNFENGWICLKPSDKPTCCIRIIQSQIDDHSKLLNGYVNFNHFCKTDLELKDTSLLKALKRCAAIECKPYQKTVDLIIPVSLSESDFNSISAILVQVKLNKDIQTIGYVDAFKGVCENFFLDLGNNNPYMMLFMELGGFDTQKYEPCIEDIKSNLRLHGSEPKKQSIIYSKGISTEIFPNLGKRVVEKLIVSRSANRKLFNLDEDKEKLEIYNAIRFPIRK